MVAEVVERDDVKAVVLTGGERVFAAGNDVKEMADMSHTDMVKRSGPLQAAVTAVARIPKPVVAAVNGYALGGGCELALAADIRVAGERTVMGQPEVLLGIIPGAGGTQRLARLVGPSKAKDIIFTGRFVKADEALAIGLVDQVVPDESVYEEALAWARQFAGAATYAVRAAKESIDRGLEVDLDTGLEIERMQFAALFATQDRTIGMSSFVENGPGKAQFIGQLSRQAVPRSKETHVALGRLGKRDEQGRRDETPEAPRRRRTSKPRDVGAATPRLDERRRLRTRVAHRGLGGLRAAGAGPGRRCAADRHRRQPRQRPGPFVLDLADGVDLGRVLPRERHPRVRRLQRRDQERPVQLGPGRGGLPRRGPPARARHQALTCS